MAVGIDEVSNSRLQVWKNFYTIKPRFFCGADMLSTIRAAVLFHVNFAAFIIAFYFNLFLSAIFVAEMVAKDADWKSMSFAQKGSNPRKQTGECQGKFELYSDTGKYLFFTIENIYPDHECITISTALHMINAGLNNDNAPIAAVGLNILMQKASGIQNAYKKIAPLFTGDQLIDPRIFFGSSCYMQSVAMKNSNSIVLTCRPK